MMREKDRLNALILYLNKIGTLDWEKRYLGSMESKIAKTEKSKKGILTGSGDGKQRRNIHERSRAKERSTQPKEDNK